MKPGRWSSFFLSMLSLCAFSTFVAAQHQENPPQQGTPQTPGVVSTGAAHAAVLDSEKRPITAGGFVDSGPIIFQDIAEKAGLTKWRHVTGTPEDTFIIETVGSGVA